MRPRSLVALFVLFCLHLVESGRRYMVDGRKYYVSYPDEYSAFQSMEFCAINSMYLIDIRTEFEQKRIHTIMKKVRKEFNNVPTHYWCSGTNRGQSKLDYFWLTTGEPVEYSNWFKGHPKADGMHIIIEIHSGLWGDYMNEENATCVCRDKVDVPISAMYNKTSDYMSVHRRKMNKMKSRRKHHSKY